MPDNLSDNMRPDMNISECPPGSFGFPNHGQDLSFQVTTSGESEPIAGCSIWHTNVPALRNEEAGIIGHFQSTSASAGALLLTEALDRLKATGCTVAIGPMDGNTWRRYRLITERGSEPPFFMEPDNPDYWVTAFVSAGFQPLAQYYSALVTELSVPDFRVPRVAARLSEIGVTIRTVNLDNFADDLRRVHALSLSSFRENYLYTDISADEFLTQYLPIQKYVVPEFVLLAEHQEKTVGFVFAIPDLAQSQRGQTIDTIILKTLAVAPGRSYAGLGALLLERIHRTAHEQGYNRVIHALMHESNQSINLSTRSATPFRRYTLFSKKLV